MLQVALTSHCISLYQMEILYNRKAEVYFSLYHFINIKWKFFTTAKGKYTFHHILLYQMEMLYNSKGSWYHFTISNGNALQQLGESIFFMISFYFIKLKCYTTGKGKYSFHFISNGNALQQQRGSILFIISFYYLKWNCFTTAKGKYILFIISFYYIK